MNSPSGSCKGHISFKVYGTELYLKHSSYHIIATTLDYELQKQDASFERGPALSGSKFTRLYAVQQNVQQSAQHLLVLA